MEATERGYGDGPRWVNWVLPGTPRHRRTKDNHEFGVIRLRELPGLIACCDSPPRIYDYWMANIATAFWYTPDVESLCAIHLNTRRRATGFHLVGIGTLDTVLFLSGGCFGQRS